MTRDFYGATPEAELTISKLLSIPVSRLSQDWELEFADPHRIDEMLNVTKTVELSYDEKCALAMLVIASIEDAVDLGLADCSLIERVKAFLKQDQNVHEAMKFFWTEIRQALQEEVIRELLG